jgi:diketogulonate reductase-like aldo/keto reductase
VVAVAERLGRTPAQVLLRWAIQHGAVVIPKSSRRERIIENARVFDFELADDDMRLLDALAQ